MIRATELSGRAVVDLDAAEKLGRVERVIIDPEARHVAAFQLTRGEALTGPVEHTTVPAAAVYAIGPDAITVRHTEEHPDLARFDGLPRASELIGRKVVSRDGRLLGHIRDVLIDDATGRIIGYELGDSDLKTKLEAVFSGAKPPHGQYVRADVDLRAGRDLIVAPENAICRWDDAPKELKDPAVPRPGAHARPETACGWFRQEVRDDRLDRPRSIG